MKCIMQYQNFWDWKSGKHIVWLLIALPCNGFSCRWDFRNTEDDKSKRINLMEGKICIRHLKEKNMNIRERKKGRIKTPIYYSCWYFLSRQKSLRSKMNNLKWLKDFWCFVHFIINENHPFEPNWKLKSLDGMSVVTKSRERSLKYIPSN